MLKLVKILLNVIIATLGVMGALGLLEIGSRFLPTPYTGDSNPADTAWAATGWRGKPHYQTTVNTEGYYHDLRLNSRGMHDTEHPLDKPPHTTRILLLGDSFVQAIHVDERETAHQILEDTLNSQSTGQTFEVTSAGVGGWGTGQQLLYYRAEGRQYEPDLVLLAMFLGNDVKDNLPGRGVTVAGINRYTPYFALTGDRLDPAQWLFAPGLPPVMGEASALRHWANNALGKIHQQSRLYQQLEPLVAVAPTQPSMLDFYLGNNDTFDYAFDLTLALAAQLHTEVAADGADFGVVLISPIDLFDFTRMSTAEREAVYQELPGMRRAEDIEPPNRQITDRLARRGIPVLDLFPPFLRQLEQTDKTFYFQQDKHWNVAGNRLAGEIMAGWVADNFALSAAALSQ